MFILILGNQSCVTATSSWNTSEQQVVGPFQSRPLKRIETPLISSVHEEGTLHTFKHCFITITNKNGESKGEDNERGIEDGGLGG